MAAPPSVQGKDSRADKQTKGGERRRVFSYGEGLAGEGREGDGEPQGVLVRGRGSGVVPEQAEAEAEVGSRHKPPPLVRHLCVGARERKLRLSAGA